MFFSFPLSSNEEELNCQEADGFQIRLKVLCFCFPYDLLSCFNRPGTVPTLVLTIKASRALWLESGVLLLRESASIHPSMDLYCGRSLQDPGQSGLSLNQTGSAAGVTITVASNETKARSRRSVPNRRLSARSRNGPPEDYAVRNV